MLTLEFSSPVSGTILDKDGEGTGFTTVQGNKAGNQKVPSLIDLNNGRLTLTATKGSSVGGINTLKNALQVGLDATETFTVSTRLKGPLTNLTTASQQAGIFFGPNDDNYVKLVVGKASNGLRIQLFRELNGISSSVDLATVPNSASLRTLDLYLTGDAERKTFSAAYRVNSDTGARLTLDQNFRLPQNQTARFFGATTARAGILAYTDQAPEVPISFFSFGIAQNVKINFQPSDSFLPTGYTKDSGLAYSPTRGFGWIDQATGAPIDISGFARDRNLTNADQRIDTLQHMQFGSTPDAAWEYAVPNGTYNVTVSVGDIANARGVYDSQHTIRVEGDTIINQFQGSNTQKYQLNSGTVKVTDGKLTIDAFGGFNTKINYLEIVPISPGNHPSIPDSFPRTRATGVKLDAAIATDVFLPNLGQGVDAATLNLNTVQLYQTFNKEVVDGHFNTSGGNDTIVFQPTGLLKPNTSYTFRVSEGVRDQSGASFQPFSTTFTTGTESTKITPGVNFTQQQVYNGAPISSLAISPDGSKLYGTGLDGSLHRWTINSSGRLSGEQIFRNPQLAGRAIIGIAFDPSNPRALWISHNNPLEPEPAKDFTGKISKLILNAGTSFTPTIQDYVVGLPRSAKDHLTQSITFGPDGKLYLSQGSNSAMGAPDDAWFNRAENLLSGAILQIDPRRTAPKGGFNVQTEDRGAANYNPFAANAPVKIFATGIRNAYDLVWHRNGNLYVPTNGSAAGGNTPEDPTQAGNQALTNVATQNDYLFKVGPNGGGYYGHPNPLRGEYILNGGNPDANPNAAEVIKPTVNSPYSGYAVGTQTDPNYRGFAYDFGRNRSPNGTIEYKNARKFGGALQNKLLVTEFSGGDDILALTPGTNGNINSGATKVFSNLTDPLDLIENTRNGNLYVAELPNNGRSGGQITLLS